MDDVFENMFESTSKGGSIIKVIGVGGGGCNAVNHMYKLGIKDVSFVVCNTDAQALNSSPVPQKIQLGKRITEGLGAGSNPEQGRKAAEESLDEVTTLLSSNTKMVFITAGMGGGTGTGAAPVIAKAAKDLGILTVAIVTIPFKCIEPSRIPVALEGIRELQRHVDSLLVINNEKLRALYGSLKVSEAFAKADDVLCTAAKGIAEIITQSGVINVDFADVRTAMQDSGIALMGTGHSAGQDRVAIAIEQAINSPLLYNNSIRGAKHVLVNIMTGTNELSLEEMTSITERVMEETGNPEHTKTGFGINPDLGDEVTVSLIATGFDMNDINEAGLEGPRRASNNPPMPPPQPDRKIIPVKDEDLRPTRDFDDFDIPFTVNETAVMSMNSVNIPSKGKRPLWDDDSISIEEKERATRAKFQRRTKQEDEEISLFTLSKDNTIGVSPALFVNGQPD